MAETAVDAQEPANPALEALVRSITQREWLSVVRTLDASKEEVMTRQELMLPALAWLHEKRAHGGASWDRVLDMTDEQILALLGLDAQDPVDPDPTPLASETGSSASGTSSALGSASPADSSPPSTTA